MDVTVNGKTYPRNPGFTDRVKEAFEPTDQRASLEAMRRALDKYDQNKDKNYGSTPPTS